MRIILQSHSDVELVDPVYTWTCLDDPEAGTFTPIIHFPVQQNGVNFTIPHPIPAQPYVNGTWGDATVNKAITNYLNSINLD